MNKRKLYESIMRNVSRQVKKVLNETANGNIGNLQPTTKDELIDIILDRMETDGPNCDLNDIDVSNITDMSYLFSESLCKFDGDISGWDVSNVTNMKGMFKRSCFNGDISDWDVSNVVRMDEMFWGSNFDGDLSKWDVSKVVSMNSMFRCAHGFTGDHDDIDLWDVTNVKDMREMFAYSAIGHEMNSWMISRNCNTTDMYTDSRAEMSIR